jgi:hypothetical protein
LLLVEDLEEREKPLIAIFGWSSFEGDIAIGGGCELRWKWGRLWFCFEGGRRYFLSRPIMNLTPRV